MRNKPRAIPSAAPLRVSREPRIALIVALLVLPIASVGCGEESAQEQLAEKQLEAIEEAEKANEDVPLCTEVAEAFKAGECIDEP